MDVEPRPPSRPLIWPPLVEQLAKLAPKPARLYLVGGAVRDAWLRHAVHDIDLCTPDDGLNIARQIADQLGGAYYPVDPNRGTGRTMLTVSGEQSIIDVATFRGNNLLGDLQGRDFTINALAVRLDQLDRVIDPLGGEHDLLDRVLRQCAPTSLRTDPIRALRAVRMALQFGLRFEPETRAAVQTAAPLLVDDTGTLRQPERGRDELFKMLTLSRPDTAFRLLHKLELLPTLCPFELPTGEVLVQRFAVVESLANLIRVISPLRNDNIAANLTLGVAVMVLDRYRCQLQEYLSQTFVDGRPLTVILLLEALTPNTPLSGKTWQECLHLSNAEARVLLALEQARTAGLLEIPSLDDRYIHRYYRQTGEAGVGGVLLALAEHLAHQRPTVSPDTWGHLLEEIADPLLDAFFRRHQQIIAPPPLLTGNDLIEELGVEPGPKLGLILKRLLEEQAAGEIHTKKEAFRLAERLSNADMND